MRLAVPAALIGAADTGAFLAARPQIFAERPQRAAASAALLALWLTVAGTARADRPARVAVAASSLLATANAGLLAAHLRAGIATPRILAGAALSGIALVDVLLRR